MPYFHEKSMNQATSMREEADGFGLKSGFVTPPVETKLGQKAVHKVRQTLKIHPWKR